MCSVKLVSYQWYPLNTDIFRRFTSVLYKVCYWYFSEENLPNAFTSWQKPYDTNKQTYIQRLLCSNQHIEERFTPNLKKIHSSQFGNKFIQRFTNTWNHRYEVISGFFSNSFFKVSTLLKSNIRQELSFFVTFEVINDTLNDIYFDIL